MIDGGGSEFSDYNVGKNTLLPYLLDRGIKKLDYIIISHFDTDHVQGLLCVMENLKVNKIIISKQTESSENFEKFVSIVKEKKIKIIIVKAEDRINIERNLYFDVLWPDNNNLITENALNNNAMVCKLMYKKFSILFTGDIEELAERKILELYKENLQILKSNVLKIAHHGSKSSTIQEFLDVVNPMIALIGVGANNLYGHPSNNVIKRLNNLRS